MPSRARIVSFFLITLFFSSWFLDQGQNANTVSRAAAVAAMVEQGTMNIDAFAELTNDRAHIKGHYYSEKAPLPAFLVLPFHWLFHRTGMFASSGPDHLNVDLLQLGGFLCGSLPFAFIITLCWSHLMRTAPAANAVLLTWATFFGSFLFVYSGSFYGHLIGAAFALSALVAMERGRYALAGALTGCAVLCDYPLIIFAGCWALHIAIQCYRSSHRPLLQFVGAGLPFAAALVLYNMAIFGSPLSVGYDHVDMYAPEGGSMIERLRPEALFGLTISPYRGLIPHMPVLALGLLTWYLTGRKWLSRMGLTVAIPAVITLLFVSSVGMWWGGWAFGPRHLTTVAVLLAYRTLPFIAATTWSRLPLLALGVLGLGYAFLAKSTVWYSLPTGILRPFKEIILPKLLEGGFTGSQWPIVFGVSPLLSTVLFLTTFSIALVRLDRAFKPTDHAPLPLS